jgi:glyoxylase I family protein
MAPPDESERQRLAARRDELKKRYVKPLTDRPASNARGIHHCALICSDVEQTIQFYDGLLGFPLVELTENRDYPGSSHFFFDLGNQTLLGFFDFPGLGLQPAEELSLRDPDGIGIELLSDELMFFGGAYLDR